MTRQSLLLLFMLPIAVPAADWSSQLRGRSSETTRERTFVDNWFHEVQRSAVLAPHRACQKDFGTIPDPTLRHPTPFEEGCYDRVADPTWTTPIQDEALTAELVSWREAREAEMDAHGLSPERGEDEDLGKRLEALGYIE